MGDSLMDPLQSLPPTTMTSLTYIGGRRKYPLMLLAFALLIIATTLLLPSLLKAGTGGVPGGCSYPTIVDGKTVYLPCTGMNLPMWYSVTQNPLYGNGDFPCGDY